MYKLILIFSISLVLLATSVAFARPLDTGSFFTAPGNSCEISNACVKSGGSCDAVNCNLNSTNATCCGSGLFCINSTCVVDTIGEWCNGVGDCVGGGPFVACANNTCKQLSLPGDGCSSDSDCVYSSSVCGNNSICIGKPVNASCNIDNFDCDAGLYCRPNGLGKADAGNCTVQLPANATCVPGADICANGLICTGNGTVFNCGAAFQKTQNQTCFYNEECSTDLYCNAKGQCDTFSSWTKVTCSNDTDCSNGEKCKCDTITGETICVPNPAITNTYCASDEESLLECVGEYNCSYYYLAPATYSLPSESCVATNCKSDFRKVNSCGCTDNKDLYGNCFQSSYCGGFPLWAIIVIAIVGVILVLVVIVVIVMVMRRRRSYDTIA